MNTPIKVKLSSTVIVLLKWGVDKIPSSINKKPLKNYDYRVMMVKRSNNIKFFPSAHVFPGGAVDEHDNSLEWENVIEKPIPSNLPIRISALREIFEETNFFLDKNDKLIKNSSRIENLQSDLMNKETSKINNFLLNFIKESDIKLNLSQLYQWARWVTPILGPKQTHRFDTYFYITPIYKYPESCKIDGTENVEMDWLSPEEALEEHRMGKISLPPPTWLTFHQLSKCHTIDQAIELAKKRDSLNILYDPIMTKPTIPSNASTTIPQERYQVLQGDYIYEQQQQQQQQSSSSSATSTKATINPNQKNRIVTRSRTGDLNDQFSWIYEYQNTVPGSIDSQYDGANTILPPKL
ncbi:hypothetical protein RB653_009271 [Dictyostelium firmibasis]|uniref:Nudix hydrolase domain-containing protein n=1 Tax=Dictyostelium firmibasis TaxID=79012 RepID=A0AAN7TV79_9MYCE